LCRIISSGTTPQVAGPEGRLREVGDFSNPRSARDGKKEWGLGVSGGLRISQNDQGGSQALPFLSIHPEGVVKGGEKIPLKVPLGKEGKPFLYIIGSGAK